MCLEDYRIWLNVLEILFAFIKKVGSSLTPLFLYLTCIYFSSNKMDSVQSRAIFPFYLWPFFILSKVYEGFITYKFFLMSNFIKNNLRIFFFLFCLFRAAPTTYGGSQARGLIRAVAAGLWQSHSNARSQPYLQPTPQLTAMLDS